MSEQRRDAVAIGDANTLVGVAVGPAAAEAVADAPTGAAPAPLGTPIPAARIEVAETLAGDDALVADLAELPQVDPQAYAVGVEIARGGMGRVLAARDRRLRRDVVIKVTHGDGALDPRFAREALITARLQHPSIVRIYEAGRFGEQSFYAMERVRGSTLDRVLLDAKTLPARLALLPHAIAVADALAYAHSEGVVHRDLKPSNVLVGPWGETVVIDWGLAKDIRAGAAHEATIPVTAGPRSISSDTSLTQVGSVLGTPGFMAPEQARGEASDARSDVYALGALVYTLLAGVAPFRGDSVEAVLEKVRVGEPPPLAAAAPGAPAELVSIVARAMAVAADARCTAKEFADELRRYAAGQLVTSHSYSLGTLLRRWIARYRAPLAVGGVALVVLAVLSVLGVRQIMAERDRAVLAEASERRASDRFILGLARKALERDPSTAAALLTKLSADGLRDDETQTVATAAWRKGLAVELRGHGDDVELLAMAPDGRHVATGSDDSTIRWWSLADFSSIILRGHQGPLQFLTISSDGAWLASCGTDHLVWLWDLRSGTGAGRPLTGHTDTVRRAAFSPDGTRLVSTGEDGDLWLWDVASGTGRRLLHHTHGLRPVQWSPDGARVIAGTRDGNLGFWSAADFDAPPRFVHLGEAEIRSLARSRDGAHLAVGTEDGRVLLLDATGVIVREFGRHKEVVRDVQFTPDGGKLISVGGDPVVRVDDVAGGPPIELKGNESGVKHLDISADGAWVASAGLDTTVRVWAIAGGAPMATFKGHSAAVKAVAFTPDGTRLVSGSEDDLARVWRLDDREPPPPGAALVDWVTARTNVMQGDERGGDERSAEKKPAATGKSHKHK